MSSTPDNQEGEKQTKSRLEILAEKLDTLSPEDLIELKKLTALSDEGREGAISDLIRRKALDTIRKANIDIENLEAKFGKQVGKTTDTPTEGEGK